jgi:Tfp pilus assembly protein PilN
MIEINLARQLQCSVKRNESSWLICCLIGGMVFIGVGVMSWWWTQSLQDQIDILFQEKMIKTQSLVGIQERLKDLERSSEQKNLLMASFERLNFQEKVKVWPVALLDGISRSIDGLDIWLERVQLEDQIVELHGQSLGIEDIGKFIEELENVQMIMNVPVVEILDRPKGESEIVPFMVRFVFDQKVTI